MPQGNQNVAKIVADIVNIAKLGTINDMPVTGVSGDTGNGILCIPGALADISALEHAPVKARALWWSYISAGAMRKAQAALKAYDKKNPTASDDDRRVVAQDAFAAAINGDGEFTFQEGNVVASELQRRFIENVAKPNALKKGMATDDATLESFAADIRNDHAEASAKADARHAAAIGVDRIYVVDRKGKAKVSKANTEGLDFGSDE